MLRWVGFNFSLLSNSSIFFVASSEAVGTFCAFAKNSVPSTIDSIITYLFIVIEFLNTFYEVKPLLKVQFIKLSAIVYPVIFSVYIAELSLTYHNSVKTGI